MLGESVQVQAEGRRMAGRRSTSERLRGDRLRLQAAGAGAGTAFPGAGPGWGGGLISRDLRELCGKGKRRELLG